MPLWGRPSHGSPGKTGLLAPSAGATPHLPLSLRLPAGGPARSPSVPGLPAARAWRATRWVPRPSSCQAAVGRSAMAGVRSHSVFLCLPRRPRTYFPVLVDRALRQGFSGDRVARFEKVMATAWLPAWLLNSPPWDCPGSSAVSWESMLKSPSLVVSFILVLLVFLHMLYSCLMHTHLGLLSS
jgi:hypothetical protein